MLGQNTEVIAQLEAQYGEIGPKTPPRCTTTRPSPRHATKVTPLPGTTGRHRTGAGQARPPSNASATGTSAGTAQTTAKAITSTPNQLQAASPTTMPPTMPQPQSVVELWFLLTGQTLLPSSLAQFVNGLSPFAGFAYNTEGLPYFSVGMGNSGVQIAKSTAGMLGGAAPARPPRPPRAWPVWAACSAVAPAAGGRRSGQRGLVGRLSVPRVPGAAAPPGGQPMRLRCRSATVSAAPEAAGTETSSAACQLAGMGGPGGAGAGPRYGFKPTVMARPPFAG